MSETFDLAEAVRPGGGSKTQRRYLDFVVEGVAVFSQIVRQRDLTSVLWLDPSSIQDRKSAVQRLLKEVAGDLPDDRVSLYACGECGDIGCGALTARIEVRESEVVWSDFGFENNYVEFVDREGYARLGPFTFDREEYESLLRSLTARCD